MSDSNNPTKTVLSNVLGIKPKAKPVILTTLTDAQVLDETVRYALGGVHNLREELTATTAKLDEITSEFAKFKMDATAELAVQKHEYDAKLTMARAENSSLRKQLDETGAKLERFECWAFQLSTKCEDYERFFSNSVATLYDAGQHQALSLTSTINNATAAMHDAVKHTTDGMLKQLQHVVDDARTFLTDMKEKNGMGHAEYRPSPVPKIKPNEIKLDPQSEQALEALISRMPTTTTER